MLKAAAASLITTPLLVQLGWVMPPKPVLLCTMTTALVVQSVNRKALAQKAAFKAFWRSALVSALA